MTGMSVVQLVLILLAVTAGAAIQGSIGFGLGYVAVPAIALADPLALPGSVLLLSLPMTLLIAARESAAIHRPGLVRIIAGRLAGTAVGVWVLAVTSPDALSVLFGALILTAALLSAVGSPIPMRTGTAVAAGAASGLFATTVGVGGPPLALLYQHRGGPALRATLSAVFALGAVASLAGLGATGQLAGRQVALALLMAPAMLLGLCASRYTSAALQGQWLRRAVGMFSAASGAIALVRGLTA